MYKDFECFRTLRNEFLSGILKPQKLKTNVKITYFIAILSLLQNQNYNFQSKTLKKN